MLVFAALAAVVPASVGNKTNLNGDSVITVVRLNRADGTPDTSFGTGGVVDIAYAGHRAIAKAVKIMPLSERVMVGGSIQEVATFDSEMVVAR